MLLQNSKYRSYAMTFRCSLDKQTFIRVLSNCFYFREGSDSDLILFYLTILTIRFVHTCFVVYFYVLFYRFTFLTENNQRYYYYHYHYHYFMSCRMDTIQISRSELKTVDLSMVGHFFKHILIPLWTICRNTCSKIIKNFREN